VDAGPKKHVDAGPKRGSPTHLHLGCWVGIHRLPLSFAALRPTTVDRVPIAMKINPWHARITMRMGVPSPPPPFVVRTLW
jgi:hypothetical protein